MDFVTRTKIADNPHTSPEILSELAKSKEWTVRIHVASNENTPLEVLVALAKDRFAEVRENAEENLEKRSEESAMSI